MPHNLRLKTSASVVLIPNQFLSHGGMAFWHPLLFIRAALAPVPDPSPHLPFLPLSLTAFHHHIQVHHHRLFSDSVLNLCNNRQWFSIVSPLMSANHSPLHSASTRLSASMHMAPLNAPSLQPRAVLFSHALHAFTSTHLLSLISLPGIPTSQYHPPSHP